MKIHRTAVGLFQSSVNYTFLPLFMGSDFKSLLLHFKCFISGGAANILHVLSVYFSLIPRTNEYCNRDILFEILVAFCF